MENNIMPYIGPRFFEKKDRDLFFGREYETRELCSMIFAHNVILCYSQSGAGKTSLINAGVIPRFEKEEFDVLPVARVSGQIPKDLNPKNIYIFNALFNWSSQETPQKLVSISMNDFLEERNKLNKPDTPSLIIFDQFEELFTHYQERWTERGDFFEQVVESLYNNPLLRIVFVMREDYIAYFDPFTSLFPNNLNIRFRLERMDKEAAISAVIDPAKKANKEYIPGAAEYLVDELLKTKVNTAQGETITIIGEYIEPVQLQVVCQNLWSQLPKDTNIITKEYVQEIGSVDDALRRFYEQVISTVVNSDKIQEKKLRYWFEDKLLTSTGTRSTVFRGPKETGDMPNDIIDELQRKYLIRSEWRSGGQWYELIHDSLIKVIQDSNKIFNENLKTDTDQLNQRGILNYNEGEYEKAITDYDKAIELDKDYKWAYQNKSLALNKMGKNKEALETINQALKIDPGDAWAYSQRGKIYNDMKEYKKAVIDLDKAIDIDDKDKWSYANKSYALNEMGENEKALEAVNKALEIDQSYAWAYSHRGKIYIDMNEDKKALLDLDKAVELGKKDKVVYSNKSYALNEMGENEKALETINKVLEIDPKDAWAYSHRGKIYNDIKEYQKALLDLDKAIELGDKDKTTYANKSYALNELGEKEKALEAINKALEIDSGYTWAYAQRGKIFKAQNEYEKAVNDFSEAIKRDQNEYYYFGDRGEAFLKQGDKSQAEKDFETAIGICNRQLSNEPANDTLYFNIAWYALLKGDYNQAVTAGEKGISLNSNLINPYFNLGLAYLALNNSIKAIENYDKGINNAKNLTAPELKKTIEYAKNDIHDFLNISPDNQKTIETILEKLKIQ